MKREYYNQVLKANENYIIDKTKDEISKRVAMKALKSIGKGAFEDCVDNFQIGSLEKRSQSQAFLKTLA